MIHQFLQENKKTWLFRWQFHSIMARKTVISRSVLQESYKS